MQGILSKKKTKIGAKMADKNKTISIRIDLQERDFKSKIKELSNELNFFRSELSLTAKQFDGQQNSLDAITAKYNVYQKMLANVTQQIEAHKRAESVLKDDLRIVQESIEKTSNSYKTHQERISSLTQIIARYSHNVYGLQELYDAQKSSLEKAQKALADYENKYTGVTRNLPWYKKHHEELVEAVRKEKEQTNEIALNISKYNSVVQRATALKQRYTELSAEERAELGRLDNQQNDLIKRIRDHEASVNKLSVTQKDYNDKLQVLAESGERAKNSINGVDEATDRWSGELKESEKDVEALAEAMAISLVQKGFSVVKEAITESINAFKDYESALAGVSKTTGMEWGGEEIAALGDDFKALSQQMPVSAQELLNVAQIAGQLGIQGSENIQKFTTVMAQMAVSTNLTSEEAATALAQMAAVTGMAASDYDKLGSAIVSLGNKYPVAEDTIVRIAQRFSGAATNANLAEGSIVALAAAAGSVGIQAESAGTSLTKLVTKMGDAVESGNGLEEWARVANMSAEDFAQLWGEDAPTAIAKFLGGFGRLGNQASATFSALGIGEARLQDLVRRMSNAEASSKMLTNALRDANEAFESGTALSDEAGVVFETLNSKTQVLQNSLNVLATEVGEDLAPQVGAIVDMGTGVVQLVTQIVEENPAIVYGLEAITAALGIMTFKALPEAFPAVQGFVTGLSNLKSALGTQWGQLGKTAQDALFGLADAMVKIQDNAINASNGIVTFGDTLLTTIKTSAGTIGAISAVVAALALLAYAVYKYGEDGDVATKKTQHASEAYETQAEVVEALAEAEEKLFEIKQQYIKEEQEVGQVSQETSDAFDEQQAAVDALKEALDGFGEEVVEAQEAEDGLSEAAKKVEENISSLTDAFEKNIAKVNDFSTTYSSTAQDYINNIQQQIEWHNKYADNRESLLSRDIKGLHEWVASWDDGTEEAAAKMNAFANATDEEIERAISNFNSLTDAQNRNKDSAEENYRAANDAYTKIADKVADVRRRNAEQLEKMAGDFKTRIQEMQTSINGLQGKTVYVRVQQVGSPIAGNNMYNMVNAQGLDYVPFDGFVSMLHEGERVLNRAEASAYRSLERTANRVSSTTNNSNIVFNITQAPGESGTMLARRLNRKLGEVY